MSSHPALLSAIREAVVSQGIAKRTTLEQFKKELCEKMVRRESGPIVGRQAGPITACLKRVLVEYPVEPPPYLDDMPVHLYAGLPAQFDLSGTQVRWAQNCFEID